MGSITFSKLDTGDAQSVRNYERALYRAFSNTDIATIDYIADFDHKNRRLRSRIPYDDQQIFAARIQETVMAAITINTNMNAPLQLETYGFTIDKSRDDVCEGLVLFSLDFVSRGALLLKLRRFLSAWLRDRGITYIYSTCSERRLLAYQILGFQKAGELVFHEEKKILIYIKEL